jgi:hypothetical protein
MKIAAYTIGDINKASSRLRSFYLFSYANHFGLEVSRPSRFRDGLNADVVHIQKKLNYNVIFAVLIYRLIGIKVIYDIDDQPERGKSFLGYLFILFLSSVITVDNEARKNYWRKFLFFKKIEVINDVADTIDSEIISIRSRELINKNNFFWLGHSSNLPSLFAFIEFCKTNTEQYKLTISIEEEAIESWKKIYPFITFIPWFESVAFENSIDAAFMILNHNFDKASKLKSDNKMVLAILAGFVPIVSRTPAYEKLAKGIDADYLLFDELYQIPQIANHLKKINISDFHKKTVRYVDLNYSRYAVLNDFHNKLLK